MRLENTIHGADPRIRPPQMGCVPLCLPQMGCVPFFVSPNGLCPFVSLCRGLCPFVSVRGGFLSKRQLGYVQEILLLEGDKRPASRFRGSWH